MANRILDIPTLDKLSWLVKFVKESGFALSLDYVALGSRDLWILHVYDDQERLIASSSASTVIETIYLAVSNLSITPTS